MGLCVGVCLYVQVLVDARKGHQMPYSWSDKGYELPAVSAAGKEHSCN